MTDTLHEDVRTLLLLKMKIVSERSCRENQNTHFMINNVFLKSSTSRQNEEKYGGAGEAKDENTTHALRMLDN
jgi:hypothetical protein